RTVTGDELTELRTQPVIRISGHVMELINGDEPSIEGFDTEAFHREPERRMRANEVLVLTAQERLHTVDLAHVRARCIAEVPTGIDAPVSPEPMPTQVRILETRSNRALRDDDDCLLNPLVVNLVEGYEHHRPAFP